MKAKEFDKKYKEAVLLCVKSTLENEIANDMWGVLKRNIITEMYGKHKNNGWWVHGTPQDSPTGGYQRRFYSGGLIDEDSVYVKVSKIKGSDGFHVFVSTKAKPSKPVVKGYRWNSKQENGFGFIRLLEIGDLGFWTKGVELFPRPFINKAQYEVDGRLMRYTDIINDKIKRIKI